jgi:hypothetical protein
VLNVPLAVTGARGAAENTTNAATDKGAFGVARQCADAGTQRGTDDAVAKLVVVGLLDAAGGTVGRVLLAVIFILLKHVR